MGEAQIKRINFVVFIARINTLELTNPLFVKYESLLFATLMREKGYQARYFLEGVSDLDFDTMTDADALFFPVFASLER